MFGWAKRLFAPTSEYFTRKPEVEQPKESLGRRFMKKFPGGPVFFIVCLVNFVCLAVTAGILFEATVAGVATSISVALLWLGAPKSVKDFVLRYSQVSTWLLDVAMTVGLTIIGFSMSATLGTIMLFLGLNISALLSLLRWMGQKAGHLPKEPEEIMIDLPVGPVAAV